MALSATSIIHFLVDCILFHAFLYYTPAYNDLKFFLDIHRAISLNVILFLIQLYVFPLCVDQIRFTARMIVDYEHGQFDHLRSFDHVYVVADI